MTATFTLYRMYRGECGVDITWTMHVEPLGMRSKFEVILLRRQGRRRAIWTRLPGGDPRSRWGTDPAPELFTFDPEG